MVFQNEMWIDFNFRAIAVLFDQRDTFNVMHIKSQYIYWYTKSILVKITFPIEYHIQKSNDR